MSPTAHRPAANHARREAPITGTGDAPRISSPDRTSSPAITPLRPVTPENPLRPDPLGTGRQTRPTGERDQLPPNVTNTVSPDLFIDARAVNDPGERALALIRIAMTAIPSKQLDEAHTALFEAGPAALAERDVLLPRAEDHGRSSTACWPSSPKSRMSDTGPALSGAHRQAANAADIASLDSPYHPATSSAAPTLANSFRRQSNESGNPAGDHGSQAATLHRADRHAPGRLARMGPGG